MRGFLSVEICNLSSSLSSLPIVSSPSVVTRYCAYSIGPTTEDQKGLKATIRFFFAKPPKLQNRYTHYVVRVQPRSFCLLALTFVCFLTRWSKGLLEASLELVEVAETAKTAKIRRLKMRLKRPAASILIHTTSTSMGAICRSLAIIFLIYVYISTILLILESFYHGQHPKSRNSHFSSPAYSTTNYHHIMHLPAPRTAQRNTKRPNSTTYNSCWLL
jgi:hypothetical protein